MSKAAEKIELGECAFERGAYVEVTEEGIRPWRGIVLSCKPSSVSGWWLDIRRMGEGMVWTVNVNTTEIREIVLEEETS